MELSDPGKRAPEPSTPPPGADASEPPVDAAPRDTDEIVADDDASPTDKVPAPDDAAVAEGGHDGDSVPPEEAAPTVAVPFQTDKIERPRLARPTGPVTGKARAFFAAPAPRPLPEVSGVMVIERTSQAWLATGAAVLVGVAAVLALVVDRESLTDALAQRDAEIASLRAAADKPAAPATVPQRPGAEDKGAGDKGAGDKGAGDKGAGDKGAKAKAVVDALTTKLGRDLERSGARIDVDDAGVRLRVPAAALFSGNHTALTGRGEALVEEIGDALSPVGGHIDVVAHTDHTARRNESEWGKSAARATSVVRALADKTKLDSRRLSAVGRGAVEHARRVDFVIALR